MKNIHQTNLPKPIAIIPFLFLSIFIACSNDNPTESNNGDFDIQMVGTQFSPNNITINVGETIKWQNNSQLTHTVTADSAMAQDASHVLRPSGAAAFNSGNVQPGGTFSLKFDIAGTYKYFCIPHESLGMTGQIIVQ